MFRTIQFLSPFNKRAVVSSANSLKLLNLRQQPFHTSQINMAVTELKSASAFKEAIASDKLSVVDFFATWCGPCKQVAPIVSKMSDKYTEAGFYKLDIEEVTEITEEYGITSMPTFLLFKNGQEVGKVIGAVPGQLDALVKAHL